MNETDEKSCAAMVAYWLDKLKVMPPQIPKAVFVKLPGRRGWIAMPYGLFPEDIHLGEGWQMCVVDADQ